MPDMELLIKCKNTRLKYLMNSKLTFQFIDANFLTKKNVFKNAGFSLNFSTKRTCKNKSKKFCFQSKIQTICIYLFLKPKRPIAFFL